MTRAAGARWALAGWLAALGLTSLPGCGEALSSLDSVQRSTRERYAMTVTPDFARRGQTVTFELALEPALVARLSGQAAYPTEIQFGAGTGLSAFANLGEGLLSAEILISPLAQEGEREPLLVFALDDDILEAMGHFWVLPALASPAD